MTVRPDVTTSTARSAATIVPEVVAVMALLALPLSLLLAAGGVVTNSNALLPVAATTVVAHLTAASIRRTGVRTSFAITSHLALGACVVTFAALRDTATARFLPTASTVQTAGREIAVALGELRSAVPPVEVTPGLVIAAMVTLWLLASFADSAAFRVGASAQAIVPYLGAALFVAAVHESATTPSARIATPFAAVTFLVAARIRKRSFRLWLQPRTNAWSPSATALRHAIAILVVAATVCGIAATTLSALQYSSPALSLRDAVAGEPRRQVTTPFVDIGQQLGPRSNDIVMRVSARSNHYWRQTSLDEFDASTGRWTASARNYESFDADERLARGEVDDVATMIVEDIPNIWIPVPWRAIRIRSDLELKHDGDTGSVIVAAGKSVSGRRVQVEVSTSSRSDGTPLPPEAIRLSEDERSAVAQLLVDSGIDPTDTLGRRSASLDGLRRLQNNLRSFDYDTTVDYSDTSTPTAAFLDARRGFCTQFASTFALAANQMGYAARVATGYTWGDRDADNPGISVVRGRHAHAWPEVFVPSRGWLAFEPTPGRGNPDSSEVTGLPGDQDDGTAEPSTTSTTTTTTPVSSTSTTAAVPTGPTTATEAINPAATSGPSWTRSAGRVLAGLALVAVLAGCRIAWVARRRRTSTNPTGTSAWDEIEELLVRDGHRFAPFATPPEIATSVDESATLSAGKLRALAVLETSRRWAAVPLPSVDSAEHDRLARYLTAEIRQRLPRRQRLAHLFGWPTRRSEPLSPTPRDAPPPAPAATRR